MVLKEINLSQMGRGPRDGRRGQGKGMNKGIKRHYAPVPTSHEEYKHKL